jgi:ATP-dependent Clp protease ATP-binding subunit ClpB
MTSNLGSHLIQEMMTNPATRGDYAAIKQGVMGVVGQHFRPEFINRIDEAVVFHPLGSGEIRAIAAIQTRRLVQRLAERDITLTFAEDALDHLAQAGYDPIYGARPLKRAVQAEVENPLARRILDGAFANGDTVAVVMRDGALAFERAA